MKRDKSKRVYNNDWVIIRNGYIRSNPYCVRCKHKAELVDHIITLYDGGTHHESNLQSLCRICHGVKTKSDLMKRRPRKNKLILPEEVVSVTGVNDKGEKEYKGY